MTGNTDIRIGLTGLHITLPNPFFQKAKCNEERPKKALGRQTPAAYAKQLQWTGTLNRPAARSGGCRPFSNPSLI